LFGYQIRNKKKVLQRPHTQRIKNDKKIYDAYRSNVDDYPISTSMLIAAMLMTTLSAQANIEIEKSEFTVTQVAM